MANTTNFGWETPDDTDLVKDGAAAMRTLGNAIDTSFVDLKGGTTGQVLSKASNTDLDYTWVTTDDANAIQNAIVDAKGDLIAASANDTPARLAVGSNGDTLLADSSATTGLRWGDNLGYTAGKNKIINGDFRINQRGFTSNTADNSFNFDRWFQTNGGGSLTVTPQTFTLGAAPVAGYEGTTFLQGIVASQSGTGDYAVFAQRIESVRTFAAQTVTISFWAKATSGTPKIATEIAQNFGTGGSPSSAVNTAGSAVTLSTSWARYSTTIAMPSISGKTLGTSGDYIQVNFWLSAGSSFASRASSIGIQNNTFQIWGVQVEAGSVATAFQTATGTLAGELAACQRYYVRYTAPDAFTVWAMGAWTNTTTANIYFALPVTMRGAPPTVDFSTVGVADFGGSVVAATGITLAYKSDKTVGAAVTVASGGTQHRPVQFLSNNSTSGYIGFSAEL